MKNDLLGRRQIPHFQTCSDGLSLHQTFKKKMFIYHDFFLLSERNVYSINILVDFGRNLIKEWKNPFKAMIFICFWRRRKGGGGKKGVLIVISCSGHSGNREGWDGCR